jgi:hypothetical protein
MHGPFVVLDDHRDRDLRRDYRHPSNLSRQYSSRL